MARRNKKGTLIGDVADTRRGKASNLPSVKPPKSSRPKRVVPRDHRAVKAGNSIGPSYGFGRRSNKGLIRLEGTQTRFRGGSPSAVTREMDRLSKGRSKKR